MARCWTARRRWLDWTLLSYAQLAELHQPPYGDRAMCLRSDSLHVVGVCGLAPCLGPFGRVLGDADSPRALPEVGLYWAVAPEYRRRGYATEAGHALVDYALGALRCGG